MKPLPWLTAQCVDLEINSRQLAQIQMSTQHTQSTPWRTLIMGIEMVSRLAKAVAMAVALALAFCENNAKLLIRRN